MNCRIIDVWFNKETLDFNRYAFYVSTSVKGLREWQFVCMGRSTDIMLSVFDLAKDVEVERLLFQGRRGRGERIVKAVRDAFKRAVHLTEVNQLGFDLHRMTTFSLHPIESLYKPGDIDQQLAESGMIRSADEACSDWVMDAIEERQIDAYFKQRVFYVLKWNPRELPVA